MSDIISVKVRKTSINCSAWDGKKKQDFLDAFKNVPVDAESAWTIVQDRLKAVKDAEKSAEKKAKEVAKTEGLVRTKAEVAADKAKEKAKKSEEKKS